MGKRFLLVLDNVWSESFREWDLLRRPLQVGAPGSKIILTTSSQSISSTVHGVLVHDLKMLLKEDCWSLFAKYAFGDNIPDEDSDLKRIGKEIVKKCNGLPLAIKTLAREFCFKFEGDRPLQNPKRVRHLSFILGHGDTPDKFLAFYGKNKCSITEFPDSICDSKQLRYLDLSGAAFDCLPERLGKLCSLETLKLSGCCHLNQLSANLSNLSKLVHLDISGTPIL
ncbi:hypothetical protein V6N13_061725 [Hibiscus sabdariffa]